MALEKDAGAGGSPEPKDADVGRKAVELGLITAAQLADVMLQLTDPPAQAKKPTSLSAALISGGLLTQKQVDVLVENNAAPTQVGKYRIIKELGRGGMGVVYEAEDQELHRRVALKMLIGSFNADPQETALEEERFIRESRLSANLPKHPHLVGVYEAGTTGGRRFIAMEFIDGKQFSDWRNKGSVTIRHQVTVLRDVAMAVEHAHKHGVIHRDLKPQNILVDSKNQPHVTDFGLAKGSKRQATLSLTASGLVMGTPAYMAPEQAEGKKDVDKRADIWALGVMLFEILTGRLPFIGATPIEILMKTVNDPVPVPSSMFARGAHAALDRTIENVCLKALAKEPKDRYPSAKAFADDLSGWLKGHKVEVVVPRKKVPRSWIIGGAVAAVALVAAIAFSVLSDSSSDRAARAEDYILQGRRHLVNHRYSDAIIAFGRAIEEDPDSRAAKAGKKEAEEKLVAMGRNDKPTPQPQPPTPPQPQPQPQPPSQPQPQPPSADDAARKARERAAELQRKELGELDAAIRSLAAAESFGSAREFLQQAARRHDEKEWNDALASRQEDLQKSVAAALGPLKDEAAQAKRRGHPSTIDSLRGRVDRWKWPEALVEFDETLAKVALPAPSEGPAYPATSEPIRGHTSGIHVLALVPDGRMVVTGSFDNFVRVWDPSTGKERKKLTEGSLPISGAASPDGRWIAVGYLDKSLRVWDTATLQPRSFVGHMGQVTGLAFSSDGKWLASSSADGFLRIWDVATATSKFSTEGFPSGAMSLALSLDGKTLAVGSAERLIRILDMPTGKERQRLDNVHESAVYALAVSPDGKQVLTGGEDKTSILIDLASGRRKVLAKVELPNQSFRQVAFTPDGRWAVVSSTEGYISFFDAATGALVRKVNPRQFGYFSVAFTRKGDLMAAGTSDGTVQYWDVKSLGLTELPDAPEPSAPLGKPGEPLKAHTSGIHVLALSPDQKALLTGSFDKSVRLWNLETRKERRALFNDSMTMGSISADGRWIGVGFTDGTLRVWDSATLQVRTFPGHRSQVMGIVFSLDGKWACSTSTDGLARFWDVASGTMTKEVGGFPLGAMSLALSADGKMVAVGSAEGPTLIRILDMPSGSERKVFENVHPDAIYTVAFSPDGRQLASSSKDLSVVLTDIPTGRRRTLWKVDNAPGQQIRTVAFTPDGRFVAAPCTNGTLKFFDAATGADVRTIKEPQGFYSLLFTRKGNLMLAGMTEGTVQFWDIKSLGLPK